MTFTVLVTVEVEAESDYEAYLFIRHALEHAKKAEIVLKDANFIDALTEDGKRAPVGLRYVNSPMRTTRLA